jgi:hypothetical protein
MQEARFRRRGHFLLDKLIVCVYYQCNIACGGGAGPTRRGAPSCHRVAKGPSEKRGEPWKGGISARMDLRKCGSGRVAHVRGSGPRGKGRGGRRGDLSKQTQCLDCGLRIVDCGFRIGHGLAVGRLPCGLPARTRAGRLRKTNPIWPERREMGADGRGHESKTCKTNPISPRRRRLTEEIVQNEAKLRWTGVCAQRPPSRGPWLGRGVKCAKRTQFGPSARKWARATGSPGAKRAKRTQFAATPRGTGARGGAWGKGAKRTQFAWRGRAVLPRPSPLRPAAS